MEFVAEERASMLALESKLSADRAPRLKHKLREALNLLDEYDKTGSAFSWNWPSENARTLGTESEVDCQKT